MVLEDMASWLNGKMDTEINNSDFHMRVREEIFTTNTVIWVNYGVAAL